MAYAIRAGRPDRAGGELTYHVLDIMHAFHDASAEGRHIELQSTCARPAAMDAGLPEGDIRLGLTLIPRPLLPSREKGRKKSRELFRV